MDDIDASGQNQNPDTQGGLPSGAKIDEPEPAQTSADENTTQPRSKFRKTTDFVRRHWDEFWNITPVHDKLNTFFTLVIAAATVVYVIVASDTLSEIRNSKTDTGKIIEAAQDQADAAGNMVDAANEISDAANSFSETAQRLAEASEIANRQNLHFFAEGNRPWLFVIPQGAEGEPVITVQAGMTLAVPLAVRNIGRSPAIRTTELIKYAKIFTNPAEEHKFLTQSVIKVPANDPRNAIVTPDTGFGTTAEVDHSLTASEATGLLQNPPTVHLVVCGRIEYESPLSPTKPGQMYTEFCYLYNGGLAPHKARWLPAIYHNEMK